VCIPKKQKEFEIQLYKFCSCKGNACSTNIYVASYHPCTDTNKKSEGGHKLFLNNYFLLPHLFLDEDKIKNYSTVCYSRRGMLIILQATDLEIEKRNLM
jgi:hypothetical protein